jgi:hypothetical protein
MEKNKGGRPRIELEDKEFDGWDQLDALIIWASEEYCAERLGVSVDTLARRLKEKGYSFADYKDKKKETIKINLRKKQYEVAMAGNPTLLIWLGKNELGQTDKVEETSLREIKINIDQDDELL